MWLSLIPQIHSPGDSPDLSMRHHHFMEENPQFYDGKSGKWRSINEEMTLFSAGKVRLQSLIRPTVIKVSTLTTPATPKHKTEKTPAPLMPSMTTGECCLSPFLLVCVCEVVH